MKKIILLFLLLLTACAFPEFTPQPTPVLSSEPPFPRLGMWWPDTYTQPLEQIARYDWVILGNWNKDSLDSLHSLNPKIRLLNSTNASEVDFNPEDPNTNQYLQVIPPEWYLTQVGTTLRADINSTQTVLPVEAVKINNIDLFVSGDSALIAGESVYIESVDAANLTLTVQRGYIRPASAHTAGTRIAAHISFWHHSWLLNVSTLSPKAVADPAIGAEHWVDYNARVGAQLLTDSRWAGILVDRSDPNESWLIGNSTARSIDPDQSNQLLSDYSAFDQSWNEGLISYLDQLRTAIGQERIIFLNWGIPHYGAVNGNNFEGFPEDQNIYPWHAQMFGPSEAGSYFEWMSKSRQPNLTMIETYEDNTGPKPDDANGYLNRCNDSSFTPNYRKMRFGLTSALLNDGYFSYEMNTEGHGSLCLMWFDEYDNAGAGRGYLGYPLGSARRIAPDLLNPVLSSGFDSSADLSKWGTWFAEGYNFTANLDAQNPASGISSIRLDILRAQGEDWRASFSYTPINLTTGKDYTLSFSARADKPRSISVWAQRNSDPWNVWLQYGKFPLTTDWQTFELPITAEGNDKDASLLFNVGAATGSVWLDDVSLREGSADIWRRDFEHGIVLVNGASQPFTVSLESVYTKINGTQDKSVNDGGKVKSVTISPRDGIILLKP